ncbi:MAG: hypothetical protein ABSE63_12120 [Thermoguttaceae bacterium]
MAEVDNNSIAETPISDAIDSQTYLLPLTLISTLFIDTLVKIAISWFYRKQNRVQLQVPQQNRIYLPGATNGRGFTC